MLGDIDEKGTNGKNEKQREKKKLKLSLNGKGI